MDYENYKKEMEEIDWNYQHGLITAKEMFMQIAELCDRHVAMIQARTWDGETNDVTYEKVN